MQNGDYALRRYIFGECLGGVMVKDVRRCSAMRTRRIRGLNPHKFRNIYMNYVSSVVKKTSDA